MDGSTIPFNFASLIDDRPREQIFRVDRSVYLDPRVLEAEFETIFESGWVFLCHATHIPKPGDFFSTHIGRQPVIVLRKKDGSIGCYINACGHRGTALTTTRTGNASTFTCPYHGLVFNTEGKCIKVKDERYGWPEDFDKSCFDLKPVARIDVYRDFVFASLTPDVADLRTHLGGVTKFLDIFAFPAPGKLEVVRGASRYIANCNWKLMHENGPDAYHVTTVHRNFANTVVQREDRGGIEGALRTERGRIVGRVPSGGYLLGNGHVAIWAERATPEAQPHYVHKSEFEKTYSAGQIKWIFGRGRNLIVFPNLLLNELSGSQLRTYRPISVDKVEITVWCLAPVDEDPKLRAARLRKFEDFFMPSGMATPDDIAVVEASQIGTQGRAARWSLMTRGMTTMRSGSDEPARELGIEPEFSCGVWDNEVTLQGFYREWLRRLTGNRSARHG